MKNYFKGLMALVLGLMILIPISVSAETYEYFNFIVDKAEGAVIKDTNIKIYASVESEPENLIERTDEFDFVEVMWSVCVETECATTEEVTDDAVFEADKDYLLMVKIKAKNEADINVWGTDKAKYNGTPIEELAGEFGNTGKELMIKTRTNVTTGEQEETTPTATPIPEEKKEEEKPENDKCLFGLSFCCSTIFGISICIWILIAIILIILIIVLLMLKSKKKDEIPLQQ